MIRLFLYRSLDFVSFYYSINNQINKYKLTGFHKKIFHDLNQEICSIPVMSGTAIME